MPLTSILFISTTLLLIVIVLINIFMGWIILRRWNYFKCSFFRIYLVTTAVNIVSIAVQFPAYRLPFHTCQDCFLSFFFQNKHFIGLEIINFLYVHCAIIQYNLCLLLSFNRVYTLYNPSSCEKKWRHMFLIFILLALFAPLIIDYPMLISESFYQYVEILDKYQTRSTAYSNELFNGIIIYSAIITFINFILNVLLGFYLFSKRHRQIKRSEKQLCIMTIALFILQVLSLLRLILCNVYNDHEERYSFVNQLLVYLEPFFLDLMVSFPPIILVSCNRIIQHQICDVLLRNDKVQLFVMV